MGINRSLLNWGVFLIAFGGIPLAVNQGWIESDIAGDLGQLWPLILVGIGLGLILRWTPFAWFGGALVAATFGVILGAAVAALPDEDITNLQGIIPAVAIGACSGSDAGPAGSNEGGEGNPDVFELDLTLSCGEIALGRAADATWNLEAAHAADDVPVIVEREVDGTTAYLGLSQGGLDELTFLGTQPQSDWRVEVPATATLSMNVTLNAAKGDVALGGGPLTDINGTFNASDVDLDLSDASTPLEATVNLTLNASDGRLALPDADVRVNATLNASSLKVCVPEAAALRVESSAILSSDDLGSAGLTETAEGVWASPGAGATGDHIDLSLTSTVSSFSIERPETCS